MKHYLFVSPALFWQVCSGFSPLEQHTLVVRLLSDHSLCLSKRSTDASGNNEDPQTSDSIRRTTKSRKLKKGSPSSPSRLDSFTAEAASLAEGDTSSSSSSSSSTGHDNFLMQEDSKGGHVNRELAERIFQWEQELRQNSNLPPVTYSIRSGLRLVEALVQEALQEKRQGRYRIANKNKHGAARQDDILYSDLVQEGLVALLDAMKHYRENEEASSSLEKNSFVLYAEREIRKQLKSSLNTSLDNRPIRLPQSVRNIVQQARETALQLKAEGQEQEQQQASSSNSSSSSLSKPTLAAVAQRMDIPPQQLRDYLDLYKRTQKMSFISVEDTIEVMHPFLDDTNVRFINQDEWDREHYQEGISIDKTIINEGNTDLWISEYYMDDLLEGDDQAWILQHEQYSGPLADFIPDTEEPSPDDVALRDMIRTDVYDFLASTLTEQEHAVIRSVFGLDTGKQASLKRTAAALGLASPHEASVLLAGGLQKLRESYTKRFVEPHLDASDDDYHYPFQRSTDSV